ncbi:MAG: type II toxin-antitoxin system PemK/MazF family toxin [Acidobacteriota bacterium]
MEVVTSLGDVVLVNLDPTVGREIKKTRPCLVISPDVLNRYLRTVIVAPMTTQGSAYPTRVACSFQGRKGQVVLDQIKTVDRIRIVKRLGRLAPAQASAVFSTLVEMFED